MTSVDPSGPSVGDLSGPDAASTLARLRSAGPVSWVPAVGGWLVLDHATARRVIRDAAGFTVDDPRFSTAQVVGPSMLSLDGPAHRRHRSAFAEPYRPRRIAARFGSDVAALTGDLLDRIRPRGRTELRSEFAGPLSVGVIAGVLGLREVSADTVLAWYRDIVAAVTALSHGEAVPPGTAAAMREVDEHVRAGLSGAHPSVLLDAVGVLDEHEVVSNAAVMMFGGIETTEAMIVNAVLHLLQHPAALAAVRADPDLVPAAVEESLRLEPAAAAVDRYARADVALGTSTVAAGDLVRVSIMAANRDPAVFADPDRFDLTRDNLRDQLAFAEGPHVCIAMDLARLEAAAAVRAVLTLPELALAAPAAATGLVFRKPAEVQLRWAQ